MHRPPLLLLGNRYQSAILQLPYRPSGGGDIHIGVARVFGVLAVVSPCKDGLFPRLLTQMTFRRLARSFWFSSSSAKRFAASDGDGSWTKKSVASWSAIEAARTVTLYRVSYLRRDLVTNADRSLRNSLVHTSVDAAILHA